MHKTQNAQAAYLKTGTMHRALAYDLDSGQMMHRTKLEGEESSA